MIIFLGIAGSGKSVQCKLLSQNLNCSYISVGELLRQNPDLVNQDKMAEGELLDDQLVINVVDKAIESMPKDKEFIVDGFPRTFTQAEWIVNRANVGLIRVVHIKINASETIWRLKLRNRRDDNAEAINRRIDEYNALIGPVLAEFRSKNIKVYEIDGSKMVDEVHAQILYSLQNNQDNSN